jgi:hypothetical protein
MAGASAAAGGRVPGEALLPAVLLLLLLLLLFLRLTAASASSCCVRASAVAWLRSRRIPPLLAPAAPPRAAAAPPAALSVRELAAATAMEGGSMPLNVQVVQGQASLVMLVQPPLVLGKGPNPRTGTVRSTGFPSGLLASGRTAAAGADGMVSAGVGGDRGQGSPWCGVGWCELGPAGVVG